MDAARLRILVVTPVPGEQVRRVVEDHIRHHDLPWDLIFTDTAEWGGRNPSYDLSRMPYDALLGWSSRKLLDWHQAQPRPAVWWEVGLDGGPDVTLRADHAAIGTLAARHFHERGVRCVATVRRWNLPVRQARFAAFLAEAARLGLDARRYEPRLDLPVADADLDLAAWLRSAPHPLGVFLHQDRDALSLIRTCQEQGLRVPDEVAVLGVDDLPAAALATPPLSSIQMPIAGIATRMVLELQRLLCGAAAAGTVIDIAPLRVAARASTGPFRTGDALVDRLRTQMQTAPGKAHGIAVLAKRAGLSASQLHRRFLAAAGVSPGAFLRACRLHLAQELLATTDLPVATVAKRCGVSTVAALWAAFRTAGLPAPAAWRSLQRGSATRILGSQGRVRRTRHRPSSS